MDQPNPMLKAALDYAAHGRPVFPCNVDKRPLTPHGYKDASADPAQITTWWTTWPEAFIGMPTGQVSGVVVLDVDVKSGKDGNEALWLLQEQHNTLPDTREALTLNGGRHLYFAWPGVPIASTSDQLGVGLDIRGDGGYVILPPSGVNGHRYEWEASSELPPAPMPDWLVALTRKAERRKTAPGTVNEHIEKLLTGAALHESLLRIAARLAAKGLGEQEMVELLRGLLERSQAPRDARWRERLEEIPRLVATAREKFTSGAPVLDTEAGPQPIGYEAVFASRPLAPRVLWPGLIPCDAFGLVGPGGVSKSSFLLWLMVHTVLGREALGRAPARSGACLYVSAEDDEQTIRYRVREICDALQLDEAERRTVAEGLYVLDLTGQVARLVSADAEGNLQFTGLVDQLASHYKDVGLVLVALDPAMYFGPGERFVNDAEAMLMQTLRRLGRALGGIAVGAVHHTGKQVARDGTADQYAGRGGSAFADHSRGLLVMHRHQADNEQYPRPPGVTEQDIEDGRAMRLHVGKFSAGPHEPQPVWIVRGADNAWRFDVHVAPDAEARQKAEAARRGAQADADMWQLARFIHVGAGGDPPALYGLRALQDQRDAIGLSRDRVRAAVARGIASHVLVEEPGSGRKPAVYRVHEAAVGKLEKST